MSQFPNDPACTELAGQLLAEMETLGEMANRNAGVEDASQLLMLR